MSHRDALIGKLKIEIATGRVVTVAGTGVSIAACANQEVDGFKVASWIGLLRHAVKHCAAIGAIEPNVAKVLDMQIDTGETDMLVSAADSLSLKMQSKSDGVFRGWLKDTIGMLTVADRTLLDAIAAFPGVLATLNYDHLFEDATGRTAVTWLETDDVQDVLRGGSQRAVVHLHGSYRRPESVVLGLRSYLAVKDHPHARAVLELFTLDRTLLFVGCGNTFEDPNFTRFIEWAGHALRDVSPRHYLLCRASEIDAFRKQLADAPWLQLLDYGATHPHLVPFLNGLAPAGGATGAVKVRRLDHGFDLAAYQAATRKRYSRLKLEDLDPTTHDVQALHLTGMFIAQSAREFAGFAPRVFELPKELQLRLRESGQIDSAELDERILDEHRRAYLEQSPRPILQIVRDPSFTRLVVLGDPGSGKSTLLQYLLLDWAEKPTTDLVREPLPLLIELREYAAQRHKGDVVDFLDYLESGDGVRWQFNRARLDAWLKASPCFVMFDGLDEVFDPKLRKEVSTAIHRFADTYPLARIIVSSRVIGFQHQAWRDEQFRHVMLQELDDPQIADFLSRWHGHAYEDPVKGEQKRALLVRAIEDSAAIRQLAGNPLLLTMMAILNRTQDLPRDRAELYEQCARLLLHQWKVDMAFATDPELAKTSLDFKDKRGLLLRVARAMQSCEGGLAGNLISEEMLEATLADGLRSVPNLRPERAARAMIDQLRGRNFMLCAVGGKSYAFVHRTFLEYFCAVEIVERFQTQRSLTVEQLKTEIFGHWSDETWHEVLCLLAGMLDPRFVRECLEWLITQSDREDRNRHILLAARCVGEVRRRADLSGLVTTVRRLTLDAVRLEIPHVDLWDEATLGVRKSESHAVDVIASVWRTERETRDWLRGCAENHDDANVRQSAMRALARGWKGDSATLPWLKTRAQADDDLAVRQSAIEEIVRGWSDDPETLPTLKACASDYDWAVRQSAIEALAYDWKDDPETLPILRVCAIADDDPDVRSSAIQALAHGWRDDPETLPFLKACAETDDGYTPCQFAVEAVARGWPEDRETLPWLITCANAEEGSFLRDRALDALVYGWKDNVETLPLVKARAQFDASVVARRTALEALTRHWKDDPETLSLLKGCAKADDRAVREAALEALSRGWKDDPETLPFLMTAAQTDSDGDLRLAVVEMLTRGWKDTPETLAILKAQATTAPSSGVRRDALVILARDWKEHPDTSSFLKARAMADEDWNASVSAVAELARHWKDDPETLAWLKACARADDCDSTRQGAVKALARGWKDDPDTLAMVKACARADKNPEVRHGAMQELVRGWKDDLETLSIVRAGVRANKDDERDVRRFAVRALARVWPHDPETLPIVKRLALDERIPTVRIVALQSLARGWKDDAETLSIVKAVAQDGDDWMMRQDAVELLARDWTGDRGVLAILKDCARNDYDEPVRHSAVEALARGWKGHSRLSAVLRDCARDDDGEVRQSAVEALARGWENDPKTLPILKGVARKDADKDVRQTAARALMRRWSHDPEVQAIWEARKGRND